MGNTTQPNYPNGVNQIQLSSVVNSNLMSIVKQIEIYSINGKIRIPIFLPPDKKEGGKIPY